MKAVLNRISRDLAFIAAGQTAKAGKSKPAAPGSKKQMAQRTRLSNVVSTYQLLSSFLRDAYEFKPRNRNIYNMFMKENLSRSKVYLDKNEAGRKACVVAPYLISEGSLPSIDLCVRKEGMISSLRVPQGFEITADTTSGEVSSALICANAGICEGDVLFVLRPVQRGGSKGQPPVVEMKVYEFELDSSAGYRFHSSVPGDLFRVCGGFIGTAPNIETGGLAYVLSRSRGNKTLVSTQSIILTPDNTTYQTYSSEEKMIQAAESYRKEQPHPRLPAASPPALSEGEGAPCGVFSRAGSLESISPGVETLHLTSPHGSNYPPLLRRGAGGEAVGVSATTGRTLVYRYVS